jgi:hypothetical protein
MKKVVKQQLENEQVTLFRNLWDALVEEDLELEEQFQTAKDLACSKWDFSDTGPRKPVEVVPDSCTLLEKNFDARREEISRRKYFLIKAFLPFLGVGYLLNKEQRVCYDYWEKELTKQDPNLLELAKK